MLRRLLTGSISSRPTSVLLQEEKVFENKNFNQQIHQLEKDIKHFKYEADMNNNKLGLIVSTFIILFGVVSLKQMDREEQLRALISSQSSIVYKHDKLIDTIYKKLEEKINK